MRLATYSTFCAPSPFHLTTPESYILFYLLPTREDSIYHFTTLLKRARGASIYCLSPSLLWGQIQLIKSILASKTTRYSILNLGHVKTTTFWTFFSVRNLEPKLQWFSSQNSTQNVFYWIGTLAPLPRLASRPQLRMDEPLWKCSFSLTDGNLS